jgi:predicted metal-binding membrane protein
MADGQPSRSASPHDIVVGHDRLTVLTYVVLLLITVGAWAHVVRTALAPDPMAGMEMAMPIDLLDGLAYVAAWGVMMTAMMLPSALPMIGLYAVTHPTPTGAGARAMPVALFTLIYLGLWTATGIPMYFASIALGRVAAGPRAYLVAGVLVAAGVFQLSPLKQVCLRWCRSPLGFFLGRWRAGWRGGLALGWGHAVYCLGCCWALMVVLVAAGAMGLVWVLLVAAVVTAEKLLPGGERIARAAGVALILLGAAAAVRPELVALLRAGGQQM